ncbi:MAG: LemA family protein [Patescibacteria group bacterium]
MKKSYIIALVIVALVVIYVWSGYNRFVTANEAVDAQWQQVEVQYQRRLDLIPNLIETVKGITKQEQDVFLKLADARANYVNAKSVDDKVRAATRVETAFAGIFALAENYPQLRSSEAFTTLMAQLEGTENRVSVERGRFNEIVKSINTMIKKFPANILARVFGFSEREYFDAATGAENVPQVNF